MREIIVFPDLVENVEVGEQEVIVMGPSKATSPRIDEGVLQILRISLKEEFFGCKRATF